MSLGRRVAINAAAAFGNQLVMAVLGLLATAVFVRALGLERFGGWGLIAAVAAWAGLLDLGLGLAVVRRVAAAHASGDDASAARAARAAMAAAILLGLLGAGAVWLLAEPCADWFHVPGMHRREFVVALRLAGLGAALTPAGTVLGAIPTGFQRLDALIKVELAATGLTLAAQVAAAALGAGLVMLSGWFVVGRVANLAFRWRLAHQHLSGLAPAWDPSYPFWRELGSFGVLKLAHQLTSQAVLYLDRFLVAAFLDLQAVAYYTVAMDLAQRLLAVPSNLGGAFYPAACAAAADRESLGALYSKTSRAVALLTFAPAVVLAVFARPVLGVWVGVDFAANATGLLQVALAAYALMALTAIPAGAADALGRPDISARYGLASIVLNTMLAVLLIPRLGVIGSGWAVLGNGILQSPLFIRTITSRVVGISTPGYLRTAVVRPLLPSLALGAVLVTSALGGSVGTAFGAVVTLGVGAAVFAISVRSLRLIDADEMRFIATLPGGRIIGRVLGA